MTSQQIKDFIKAMDDAGITNYQFLDGFETIFYNNDNTSLLFPDYSKEVLIEVRSTIGGRKGTMDNKPFTINYAPFDTIAEARVGIASMKQLTEVAGYFGITLDNDQYQQIGKAGFKSDFVTNDYTFKELSQEEYDALSDDEKEKYDKEKDAYEKRKAGVSQGGASVNTGGFPLK